MTQVIKMTPHDGGKCPVDIDANVLVMYNSGDYVFGRAQDRNWNRAVLYALAEFETIEPTHSTIVPPEVWAVLDDSIQWAATDDDGEVYFYTEEPEDLAESWFMDGTGFYPNIYKSVKPATCDWRQSKVRRPK